MRKIAFNLTIILSIIFTGCGGEGIKNTNSNPSESINEDQSKQTLLSSLNKEPYYKYAWHINENNILNTSKNAHINILPVWEEILQNKQRGLNNNATIAVIDDGFDLNHEDYKDKITTTCNVDKFTPPKDSRLYETSLIEYCKNNFDVSSSVSDYPHGTVVTGILSSQLNKKGIVGIAPLNNLVLIKQSYDSVSQTIAAFDYAALMGAKVINCSWGTKDVSQAVANKIKELKEKNINIVFASGNGDNNNIAENLDTYGFNDESELDSVIGVGASSEYNDVTSFSNYGKNIDILAPGGEDIGILSTFKENIYHQAVHYLLKDISSKYTFSTGTSFSAPIVSGTIALLLRVNPSLTTEQIRTILIETADKIGYVLYEDRVDDNTNSTFNEKRAYGKINVHKAYERAKQLIK